MTSCSAGSAITALHRSLLPAVADAIRQGRPVEPLRRAHGRRYAEITAGDDAGGAWGRLEARARVVAAWGRSDRKALADAYEALTGEIPPTLTVEDLRAAVERLRAAA